jgi:hypothetical protein
MRPRTGFALLLAGAVVLGAGWYFGPARTPQPAQSIAAGQLMFPDLAASLQNAAAVEVMHQGKTLVIRRQGDTWGLADRAGYPVQTDKLRGMLTALTELRLVEPRSAEAADYARLGLQDPNAPDSTANLLRVLDKDGKPIAELVVGHRRVLTAGNVPDEVFVRRPGEARTWLAEGSLVVDADPQLWLQRDIMNIDHARIARVSVDRDNANLIFEARDGKLTMTSPAEHPPLDNYKLEDITRGLELLTCEDVTGATAPSSGEIGKSVFATKDGLQVTTRLYQNGKEVLARFEAAGDGSAKAEAASLNQRVANWTYRIGAWKETALAPKLSDLEAKSDEKPATNVTQ